AAGAVWTVNTLDGTVSKIDAERSSVATTVPVGRDPLGVAARGDRVWVTDEAGVLTEIDARRATVVRRTALGNRPGPLAIGDDGILVTVRSSGAAHRGGVLRVVAGDIDTLDSSRGYDELSWALMNVIGDGLVAFRRVSGTTGGQIVPDLAISLPVPTDGGRIWSFRLRRGVRYATGQTVRASDFRRGIERSFGPGAPGPYFFGTILGAERCSARHCDLSRGITTDDAAGTITFRLREPDPDLLYKLAMSFAFPAPSSAPARDVRAGLPGTGPYRVAEFADERIVLTRNPRFREHSSAAQPQTYPDRIEVRLGLPQDAQLDVVERGDADVAFDASSATSRKLERLQTTRASQLYVHPSTHAVSFVVLNTRRPPFDDVRARRAVNFAVDRRAIVREGHDGLPTCQILPRDIFGYRRYCPYPHDPERARRLVVASGTEGAKVVVSSPRMRPARTHMATVARAMRAVGYRARLRVLPHDEYFDAIHRKSEQAGFFGWVLDYPSPTNILDPLLICGRPENVGSFCDRGLDARIRQAGRLQTTDQAAAAQLWAQIDRAITDQAPWVPISNFARVAFVSERVGNFQYHPQWGVLLDQLWVR
ncbi:MAG TPA: ABC transporter substrate-binding protein, partial [Solirubrobacteraceae bacterium]|nr:ABC transporter substrate-binding protein [Solirubrobacteraceae bacterium]